MAKQTKSKGKTALKKTGRALKGFAQGALSAGAQILGAGAEALNPVRRKVRNKYIDLVIKGQAKKTPQGWQVGKKTFAQGRGTASVSSGYYLDRSTGLIYAKRERNIVKKTKKKASKRNASRTVNAAKTAKRRSAASSKTGHKKTASHIRSVAKTRKAPAKRASSNPARKGMRKLYREAKRISKITRGRYFSSELGQRKAARHEKRHARKSKLNPSAESIRKEFAGSVSGSRDLYFPQGTPTGELAKLGKLISITTEEGTIKPVSGSAWLCADTKGKLHIGSLSGAPLFDGPKRSFGKVSKVEYLDVKKHLGHTQPTIFFHKVGEENGIKPTLTADGKGGLVFKGGDYRITYRGLEN